MIDSKVVSDTYTLTLGELSTKVESPMES